MAAISPIQASFNAGELTPLLAQRTDQNVRTIGLKTMLGFLPLLQGGAEAAPGTIFVEPGKGPFRCIPFVFTPTQSYVIEASDGAFRFYTNDARIMDGAAPYELAVPYSWAQVQALTWAQDYDALYLFHPDVPTQRLIRTGADTFAIADAVMENGPLEPRNGDQGVTVAFSDTSGTVTVEAAGSDLFEAGDVGGLMEIECIDLGSIPGWEPGMKIDVGSSLCQWNGNVYLATGGNDRTGNVAPIHTEGTEWDGLNGKDVNGDGPYGVRWTYQYDRFGLIRFTVFTDSTHMEATVIRRLASTAASYRWRFGALSARRGYAAAGVVGGDRLVLGHTSVVRAGVAEDLTDFSIRNEFGDVSQDESYTLPLDNAAPILWMLSETGVIIGTSKAVHILGPSSAGAGLGPGNVVAPAQSHYGSAAIQPVAIDGRLVYVQTSRRTLIQMVYDSNRLLRQESPNLSRYADHIAMRGIADLAWQQEPRRLLWMVLDDGTLAACAYDPDEQLLGWCRRSLADGLSARSLCSIPSPDASYDQIWLSVQAGDAWWMLRMAPIRRTGDPATVIMSDGAVIYQGAATTTISAPHLAGRAVEVVADRKVHGPVTLDGTGAGTLDYPAAEIVLGLAFDAEIETFAPDGGVPGGTALNKIGRVSRIDVGVLDGNGLEASCQGETITAEDLMTDSPPDTAFPRFTGSIIFENLGRYDRDGSVRIRRYLPLPSTITSLTAYFEKGER